MTMLKETDPARRCLLARTNFVLLMTMSQLTFVCQADGSHSQRLLLLSDLSLGYSSCIDRVLLLRPVAPRDNFRYSKTVLLASGNTRTEQCLTNFLLYDFSCSRTNPPGRRPHYVPVAFSPCSDTRWTGRRYRTRERLRV